MNYLEANILQIVATLLGLVLGLAFHEFAHALMGHYLGDTTAKDQGRLTINPLAHIDPLTTLALPLLLLLLHLPVFAAAKPVPFNPWAVRGGKWGVAAVAAAGPLTNLVIAVFFAMWLHFVGQGSVIASILLGSIVTVNVSLFVFNSIPVPPLDGSRVLYAAAPAELRELMDRIERAGLVVVFALVMLLSYTPLGAILYQAMKSLTALLLPTSVLP